MRAVYLLKEFARRARRSRLDDDALLEAVDRAEEGKIDADLGGGVIKQRVARPRAGRSGGFRTVIAYQRGERAIFLHMFAKAGKANLDDLELSDLRKIAKFLMKLDEDDLRELAVSRGWRVIERY